MLPTGQGGGVSHQRGNAFPTPAGRLYGFRRQRRHKKWRPKGRHTFPAERYYITSEGESPQPACKAKPITGRTLAAQGQRPGGWLNPHARKGVSTFGNTGKHCPGPDPDRAERRLNPQAPKGLVRVGNKKTASYLAVFCFSIQALKFFSSRISVSRSFSFTLKEIRSPSPLT